MAKAESPVRGPAKVYEIAETWRYWFELLMFLVRYRYGSVRIRQLEERLVADVAFSQLPDYAPNAVALSSLDHLNRC